ncbi:hypothetical protein, partial [Klebsiella oxytoca]|uniref:hypothetical protein n=1 Tax=Klebsiella oxytoca TaxID=571 RepID=UPI001952EFA2
EVALEITATALAATRLCDLDEAFLSAAGLTDEQVTGVLVAGFDAVTEPGDPALRERLREHLRNRREMAEGRVPAFVAALAEQPRAGVT